MKRTKAEKVVTIRTKAFSGCGVSKVRCVVDADGTVRVFDELVGIYTTCHSMNRWAQARVRRLAAA